MKEGGQPHTAHTTSDVRFVVIDDKDKTLKLKKCGKLADIMPTILCYMGLKIPKEVSGDNLIQGN
jgi:2,3-bisphosphoglycerate-independent phosphoglycerate mutase